MIRPTPSKSEICLMYPDFPSYRIRKIVNEILTEMHKNENAKFKKVLSVREFEKVKEELGDPPMIL